MKEIDIAGEPGRLEQGVQRHATGNITFTVSATIDGD